MPDPWSYADKTKTEHAEQVALFMWANMAEKFGVMAANDPFSYTMPGYALKWDHPMNGKLPQLKWLHAIHNQGHGDAIRGAKAKSEGVKAGVADIFLPVPRFIGLIASRMNSNAPYAVPETAKAFCGLYIEMKRANGGSVSQEQIDFASDVTMLGYKHEICHGWLAARKCILSYLGIDCR